MKYQELAIKQWELIVEHNCDKYEALDMMDISHYESPGSDCFACESIANTKDTVLCCSLICPVKWYESPSNLCHCTDDESPYRQWATSENPEDRKTHAKAVLARIKNHWTNKPE